MFPEVLNYFILNSCACVLMNMNRDICFKNSYKYVTTKLKRIESSTSVSSSIFHDSFQIVSKQISRLKKDDTADLLWEKLKPQLLSNGIHHRLPAEDTVARQFPATYEMAGLQ